MYQVKNSVSTIDYNNGETQMIDLNDPKQFTRDNVKILIASKDDSVHRRLRVDSNGIAYISNDVGNINIKNLAFRLET